jgi:hypothetical protein
MPFSNSSFFKRSKNKRVNLSFKLLFVIISVLTIVAAVGYSLKNSFDNRSKASIQVESPKIINFIPIYQSNLIQAEKEGWEIKGYGNRETFFEDNAIFAHVDLGAIVNYVLPIKNNPSIPNSNLRISLDFKDQTSNNQLKPKVSLLEVVGTDQNNQSARFYIGINHDGSNDYPDWQKSTYCIGNSLGDIENFNKIRPCLNTGINRQPRINQWQKLEIYVTEIGTYATIDGIPSFIFGRNLTNYSRNDQVAGLFTALKEIDEINLYSKAQFSSQADCSSRHLCSAVGWKNFTIDEIELNGSNSDHLFATTQRYLNQYSKPFDTSAFSDQPTLKYRYIADDLAVRAFYYIRSQDQQTLDQIKTIIHNLDINQFSQGLKQDMNSENVLFSLRGGQAVYSFGLSYHLLGGDLTSAEREKLTSLTKLGVEKYKQLTFGSGYPCPVRQNPYNIYDTRVEECMWKVKALASGLLIPTYSQQEKIELQDLIFDSLTHGFSREEGGSQPQAPGFNVFANGQIANHHYKNNPSYSVCSTLGNLLDVNVAINFAQEAGMELKQSYTDPHIHNFMRPISTERLWTASQHELGLSNRLGYKIKNPYDFLFFPFTNKVNDRFSQSLPEKKPTHAKDISWELGLDDWGTTTRWCSSGVLLGQTNTSTLGQSTFNDFEQLVLTNAYLDDLALTYPTECYLGEDFTKSGYRCVYDIFQIQDPHRKQGLDLKRAHRDMISYLFLYDINLKPIPTNQPTKTAPSNTPEPSTTKEPNQPSLNPTSTASPVDLTSPTNQPTSEPEPAQTNPSNIKDNRQGSLDNSNKEVKIKILEIDAEPVQTQDTLLDNIKSQGSKFIQGLVNIFQ